MSPTMKIAISMLVSLVVLGLLIRVVNAASPGNVMITWPAPPAEVTNTYVYEGATPTTMTQVGGVAAPGTTFLMMLSPGHYCFSAIMQSATSTSPMARAVCANVTATGLTVIKAPTAPTGFGAG